MWNNSVHLQTLLARHLSDIFLGTLASAPPGRHFFDDFAHDAVGNIRDNRSIPLLQIAGIHSGARPF